ncbi:putative vegetative incompatibility protein HET-E-1 [Hyaloscypha bicolor E]|uniref:Putative vegetative incompatibility protein HET-E-1 n=1 Tax=Hyaloscypha bicolor E TaxID=1095630 RepID=A0A2J6SUC1_9HELO|nr:putative vegetative incompatibility protein HET-E-1 [Hyaloscypha bicolor E]PMD54359.1 putative vegetative incompatibility protein HET-E-1 [Hyaloscypha bicolor E]
MRLLHYNDDGEFSLTQFFDDIPPYAILSHIWGLEEVTFGDMMDRNMTSKTGFDKIRFCGEQARRDGLQYFWVDTCCIDKTSSAELAEAINSMFRWYRNAAKCYVFFSDVPRPTVGSEDRPYQLPWESALRASRWFTRGWTLQELITPASVEIFSKDWERLGDKNSLERLICEITGIPSKALRGTPLADFSMTERMLWAEPRQTTREEDMAYSLLGIFDVYMPLIYGEGRENAARRLREAIDGKEKGIKYEDFSIPFSLSTASDIEHFVAREDELGEIYKALSGDGSRRTVVGTVILYSLGGIGKTQLALSYTPRYKDNYSAIFWLNIKNKDSLKQSFAKVARQILYEYPLARWLSNINMKNLDNIINAIKSWQGLPYNTRWLIIYNNYDNPILASNKDPATVDITKYIPEVYQGSVLITIQSSEVEISHLIQVKKLVNIRNSLKILSNASRRKEVMDGKPYLT